MAFSVAIIPHLQQVAVVNEGISFSQRKSMTMTDYIGITAGICTSVSLLPQLIKMIKERNTGDISFIYLSVLLTGLVLWVWYGVRQEDLPVILSNAFAVLLNVAILVTGILFKDHK